MVYIENKFAGGKRTRSQVQGSGLRTTKPLKNRSSRKKYSFPQIIASLAPLFELSLTKLTLFTRRCIPKAAKDENGTLNP